MTAGSPQAAAPAYDRTVLDAELVVRRDGFTLDLAL